MYVALPVMFVIAQTCDSAAAPPRAARILIRGRSWPLTV